MADLEARQQARRIVDMALASSGHPWAADLLEHRRAERQRAAIEGFAAVGRRLGEFARQMKDAQFALASAYAAAFRGREDSQ